MSTVPKSHLTKAVADELVSLVIAHGRACEATSRALAKGEVMAAIDAETAALKAVVGRVYELVDFATTPAPDGDQ